MAVTELALLQVLENSSLDHASLRQKFLYAKQTMESFTRRSFYYYQQAEDPNCIYIIGEWESVDQHRKEFLPSPANQGLLSILAGDISVQWMFHIHREQQELPLDAPVISIGRYFVHSEWRQSFERVFSEVEHHLTGYTAANEYAWAWRAEIEKPGKEEFVIISGWETIDQHRGFAKTEGFKNFQKIEKHLEGADVKHARKLQL